LLDLMHQHNIEPNLSIYHHVLENLERHGQSEHALAITNRGESMGVIRVWKNSDQNVIDLKLKHSLFSKSIIRWLLQYFIIHYDKKYTDVYIIVGNGNLKQDVKKYLKEGKFPRVVEHFEDDGECFELSCYTKKIDDKIASSLHQEKEKSEGGTELEQQQQSHITIKVLKKHCLVLRKKDIEKFVYFNAFEEPTLLNMLPKWIYF
jgi:hypothetical protein